VVSWFPRVSLIAMRASRLCRSMITVHLAKVESTGVDPSGKGVDGCS